MAVFTLTATPGPDGRIRFDLPAAAGGHTLEITVTPNPPPAPERLGWPPGYFEATAGALPDFGLDIEDWELPPAPPVSG